MVAAGEAKLHAHGCGNKGDFSALEAICKALNCSQPPAGVRDGALKKRRAAEISPIKPGKPVVAAGEAKRQARGRSDNGSLSALEAICKAPNCQPGDLLVYEEEH